MTITPKRKTEMPELTDTFIKAGLNKGWLIPPRNDYSSGLETLLSWIIWILIGTGAAMLVYLVAI